MPRAVVLATRSTQELADQIFPYFSNGAKRLAEKRDMVWTVERGKVDVQTFSNDENQIIIDTDIRDSHVVIFHTRSSNLYEYLFELFQIIYTARTSAAKEISVVFPYMPFVRSDAKKKSRASVTSKMLMIILHAIGTDRILLAEPHCTNVKHYFPNDADEIPLSLLVSQALKSQITEGAKIVFPDVGASKRFENVPLNLDIDSATVQKSRAGHDENPQAKRLVGSVDGSDCFIFDDEILTGSSIFKVTNLLKENGAKNVTAAFCHGILAKKGVTDEEFMRMLDESNVDRFILTNTTPIAHKIALSARPDKFVVIDTAELLGEAAASLVVGASVSKYYEPSYYGL